MIFRNYETQVLFLFLEIEDPMEVIEDVEDLAEKFHCLIDAAVCHPFIM